MAGMTNFVEGAAGVGQGIGAFLNPIIGGTTTTSTTSTPTESTSNKSTMIIIGVVVVLVIAFFAFGKKPKPTT